MLQLPGSQDSRQRGGRVVATNDERLYRRVVLLSEMGRTDSQGVFWSDELGCQSTIANLTAAVALAQVERIEELVGLKRQIFGGMKSVCEALRVSVCFTNAMTAEAIAAIRRSCLPISPQLAGMKCSPVCVG